MKIYNLILKQHGHQNWWPSQTGSKFEVCIGAILTQNTNWSNVEKAIGNMIKEDCVSPEKISAMSIRRLESLVRPSGFFRQKARRLREFSKFVLRLGSMENFAKKVTREELLGINGIGPETADSILLYACGKPYFVVDAYTRRMFSAIGLIEPDAGYESVRSFFEKNLEKKTELYKEFHALIVKHSKKCCRGFVRGRCILGKFAKTTTQPRKPGS